MAAHCPAGCRIFLLSLRLTTSDESDIDDDASLFLISNARPANDMDGGIFMIPGHLQ